MAQNNSTDKLWIGLISILALNLFVSFFSVVLGGLGVIPLLLFALTIGITQLLYVAPIVSWSIRKRRWEFMKGAIIAAIITALLNGGCWIAYSNNL